MKDKKRPTERAAPKPKRPYAPPKLVEDVVFERRALAGCAMDDPFSAACSAGPAEFS
jgi:hypothetical protein